MDPGYTGGLIGVPLGSYQGLFFAAPLLPRVGAPARARCREGGLVLLGEVLANSPSRLEERSGCLKRSLPLPFCGNISGKEKGIPWKNSYKQYFE